MIKAIKHYFLIVITSWMLGISNVWREEDKMLSDFFEREPIVEVYNLSFDNQFADFEFQQKVFGGNI